MRYVKLSGDDIVVARELVAFMSFPGAASALLERLQRIRDSKVRAGGHLMNFEHLIMLSFNRHFELWIAHSVI